jgi:sn1-specific diacylglycerol lipase
MSALPYELISWIAQKYSPRLPAPCNLAMHLLLAGTDTRYAAHAGILEAARATFLDIQKHRVLHDALLAPGGRCHGYRLVVTGHSLGAGCAFLLALYLRQFCPDLR